MPSPKSPPRSRSRAPGPKLVLATLVGISLLAGCRSDAGSGAAGALEVAFRVDSIPLLSIGEVEGAPPEYLFSGIAAVRLLPAERLLVADRSSGTIRFYGPDGSFERELGGIGDGPGEFQYVGTVVVRPPDTILVYDSQALRLTTFGTDGSVQATLPFHLADGRAELYLGGYSDGGHAIAWIQQTARDPNVVTPDWMRVGRFSPEGRLVAVIDSGFGMRRLGSPLPFSPHFLVAMLGDTVFHSDGLDGRLNAVGPSGEAVRTIYAPGEPWTLDAAWQALEPRLDSTAPTRFASVRDTPAADSIPTISDLLADPGGRLWVKRYDPASDSHWLGRGRRGGEWLVLETDGRVLGRVEIPDGLRLMDVGPDRIAGVSVDELGVERVRVYGLSEGS